MKNSISLFLLGLANTLAWFGFYVIYLWFDKPLTEDWSLILQLILYLILLTANCYIINKLISRYKKRKKLFRLFLPIAGYILGLCFIWIDFFFGDICRSLIDWYVNLDGNAGGYAGLAAAVMGLIILGMVFAVIIISCLIVLIIRLYKTRKTKLDTD